jgi:hypothetical protein
MEAGELGVPFLPVVSHVEVEHNLILDSATIQHHLSVEQHALVQTQKIPLAMPSNVQLVK